MQVLKITSQDEGQRLDKFLCKFMAEAPKSFFYKMLRKKNIVLNGKKAEGMERLVKGDEIKLFLSDETIAGFRKKIAWNRYPAAWQLQYYRHYKYYKYPGYYI